MLTLVIGTSTSIQPCYDSAIVTDGDGNTIQIDHHDEISQHLSDIWRKKTLDLKNLTDIHCHLGSGPLASACPFLQHR